MDCQNTSRDRKSFDETSEGAKKPSYLSRVPRSGNPHLDDLLASSRSHLYQAAFRILSNPHDSEDAVQDSLLRASKRRFCEGIPFVRRFGLRTGTPAGVGPRTRQQRWSRSLLPDGRFAEIYSCFDGSHHSGESNPLPKECNHESTIDVGLVPHSSSPLSLDDVSGDSIRAVAFALILCAGQAPSIDRCGGRKDNAITSPAQHRVLAGEDNPRHSGW
jgi:hypothetical protein